MVRVRVHLEQHNSILPIVEFIMEVYYNEDTVDKLVADTTISRTICTLEKVVNSSGGKFFSIKPRGKMDKNAKIGVFLTIIFQSLADIKKFEYNLGKMFE